MKRWAKIDGQRTLTEKHQKVFPWRRPGPNGSCAFFIRVGGKPIEFEKGKAAIAVPSQEKLPAVIDTLITAVQNGELDEQLLQATKAKRLPGQGFLFAEPAPAQKFIRGSLRRSDRLNSLQKDPKALN